MQFPLYLKNRFSFVFFSLLAVRSSCKAPPESGENSKVDFLNDDLRLDQDSILTSMFQICCGAVGATLGCAGSVSRGRLSPYGRT